MEPKKVIKKFTEFSDRNYPSIFNNGGDEATRTFRRVMELPMGDRLGLFLVDAEKPLIQQTHIPHPWIGEEPIMGRNLIQPIQVIFRDGINTDETEFQDFMRDWLHDQIGVYSVYKKNICIKTLDPTGVELERWDLRGCFPSAVIHTTNDNNTQTLEMTLHYDYCSTTNL
jgi:hypothetical protein|tara:strand:+ start:650 stop:1159 length:510 start_codon:yes stop_codon:yes gene_type:complete